MRILILGAGVIGTTSAWYLAKAGHEVIVIDRQPGPGMETSFANGGQISASHPEPWAAPGMPLKILKWLAQDDAPLLFRPRWNWQQLSWAARFLGECTESRYRFNLRNIANLIRYSHDSLRELRAETGIAYDQLTKGILQFYTDPAGYEQAARTAEMLRGHGVVRETKSRQQAVAIEPALAALGDRLAGACYAADDESGDAHLFTRNLAALCEAAGALFCYGKHADRLFAENGRIAAVSLQSGQYLQADAYVVALGSYSPLLLRTAGVSIPVYPTKGYSATLDTAGRSGAPSVSLTDEAHKLVFSRLGERLRVAGTAELSGYDTALNPLRCAAIVKRTRELFPDAADYNRPVFWAGLRPTTPSNRPLIGRSPRYANLFLNTGHGTLGWTGACGSARALADIVSGRKPEVDYHFLGAARA